MCDLLQKFMGFDGTHETDIETWLCARGEPDRSTTDRVHVDSHRLRRVLSGGGRHLAMRIPVLCHVDGFDN
jgi:hypothetical protein